MFPVPSWVVPSRFAVADVAGMAVNAGSHPRAVGILAALSWAAEQGTRDVVASEATRTAMAGDDPETTGRADTLYWLAGVKTTPPVRIPRRHPDGSLPTSQELYDQARAAAPHRNWIAEERRGARAQAELDAAEARRLAELAAVPARS